MCTLCKEEIGKMFLETMVLLKTLNSRAEKARVMSKLLEDNEVKRDIESVFNLALHHKSNHRVKLRPEELERMFDYSRPFDIIRDLPSEPKTYKCFKEVIMVLPDHTLRERRGLINDAINSLNPYQYKILGYILNRGFDIQLDIKSINSLFGFHIDKFEVMLASPRPEKINVADYFFEEKLDGVRVEAIGSRPECFTRIGNRLQLYRIEHELARAWREFIVDFPEYKDKEPVFSMEVTMEGDGERLKTSGLLNSINSKSRSTTKEEDELLYATIFHIQTLDEFEGLQEPKKLSEVRGMLQEFGDCIEKSDHLRIAPIYHIDTEEELYDTLVKLYKEGKEGLIGKRADGKYVRKRSKDWIKFKKVVEADFIIKDLVEGQGKRAGKVGALCVESADGLIKSKVGTGLTDEDVEMFSKDPKSYIGKIVTVRYNYIIETDKGKSLFLPVYKELRFDKTTADTLETCPK